MIPWPMRVIAGAALLLACLTSGRLASLAAALFFLTGTVWGTMEAITLLRKRRGTFAPNSDSVLDDDEPEEVDARTDPWRFWWYVAWNCLITLCCAYFGVTLLAHSLGLLPAIGPEGAD